MTGNAKWLLAAVLLLTGFIAGWTTCGWKYDATLKAEKAEVLKEQERRILEVQTKNRELQETVNGLNHKRQEENDDAKRRYDALLSRIHRGTVRVSIPVREDSGLSRRGHSGHDDQKARAELDPETVERILAVGRDGDQAIRDLNFCIDQYNAVRNRGKVDDGKLQEVDTTALSDLRQTPAGRHGILHTGDPLPALQENNHIPVGH